MAHKAAHYVISLLRPDLLVPDMVEAVLDLLLSDDLPYLTSLDEWWKQIVRRRRREVKSQLADEFGLICECCDELPPTDLHEVHTKRSADTTWRQILLFSRENCANVCRPCHESGRADTEEFKERIRERRAS